MVLCRASQSWKISAMGSKSTEKNRLGLIEVPSGKFRRGITIRMVDAPAPDLYEIRPRKDRDGFDLMSDRLRHGPIWYAGPDAVRKAVAYAKYRSWGRSHRAIIRVLDHSGAVVATH